MQHIIQHIVLKAIALWRLLLLIFKMLGQMYDVLSEKEKNYSKTPPRHRCFRRKDIALMIFCKFVLHAGE